ncbi:unnamed protein product [Calypogeia fissa]
MAMEKEDAGDSTSEWNLDKELELDDILRFEKRLKALRWRERAEAANFAASILVKDGHLRNFTSKEGPESSHVANVYFNLLRQLLHGLARHDSNWQVRVAAVDSATTILTAAEFSFQKISECPLSGSGPMAATRSLTFGHT